MDIGGLDNVTFGPDDMSNGPPKCISITPTVDGVLEPAGEGLLLVLDSPEERVLFNPSGANVTIISEFHSFPPP